MGWFVTEKFCSGCRRWKPEHLIESRREVVFPHGKAINYYCGVCAEKQRVQAEKRKATA